MSGISPSIPLNNSRVDVGYGLNKSINDAVKQNFKTLLLTNPGEKTFDSKFGVGLKQYLFVQSTPIVETQIIEKINDQTRKYMPYLNINSINITRNDDFNQINIKISYFIKNLGPQDILEINIGF